MESDILAPHYLYFYLMSPLSSFDSCKDWRRFPRKEKFVVGLVSTPSSHVLLIIVLVDMNSNIPLTSWVVCYVVLIHSKETVVLQ